MATIEVRMPIEARAREVAKALRGDPADRTTLGGWGRHVGYETTSAFVAAFHRETGMTPAAYFRLAP